MTGDWGQTVGVTSGSERGDYFLGGWGGDSWGVLVVLDEDNFVACLAINANGVAFLKSSYSRTRSENTTLHSPLTKEKALMEIFEAFAFI